MKKSVKITLIVIAILLVFSVIFIVSIRKPPGPFPRSCENIGGKCQDEQSCISSGNIPTPNGCLDNQVCCITKPLKQ